jgi:hypothetical protein
MSFGSYRVPKKNVYCPRTEIFATAIVPDLGSTTSVICSIIHLFSGAQMHQCERAFLCHGMADTLFILLI